MTTAEKSGDVTVTRAELPPAPVPSRDPIDQWDTYAEIRCGDSQAKVERFSYWHPSDGKRDTEVTFECRINSAADNGAGTADICSDSPRALFDLAQLIEKAASVLSQAQGTRGAKRRPL